MGLPRRFSTEDGRRKAVLRVMCLALMMVVASVASLNVALPDIARDTGASQTQLQWIVDAYALVFAALLLPAGVIGDRFGRKPLLSAGLALFGGVSAAALVVHSPGTLIALRAGLGIAAALIMPVTLSVITTIFPREQRGKAVGTWVGVAAAGGVVGLVVSGILLHFFSWSSIFALNVILAGFALVGTIAIVPATRESRPPRPLQRREPMLDPRNFLRRGFGAGSLSISVQFFAAFGFLFLALPYLQLVLGYTPLRAAAALLPMALVVMPLARFAPRIAGRLGVRVTGPLGLGLMATGFLVFSTLGTNSTYWHFLAGLLPFGAGMALSGAPATTAIVASLPREQQGVASAMNDVSRELGGALGIAVLGSVLNTAYRSSVANHVGALPPDLRDRAQGSLGAAVGIGQRLHLPDLVAQANVAFVHGVSLALVAGAATLLAGAVFVAVRAPGRTESEANAGRGVPTTLATAQSRTN